MANPIDWAELPYFLAVARTGSLRAAADTLGGTHATVDRHLKSLEKTYGVRLFDRSKQGLSLTEAGETLIPLAEAAEEAVIVARRKVQGLDREASGKVRISVPPSLAFDILPPIFAGFTQAYPDIELEVVVTNRFENIGRAETDVSVRVAYNVDDDVVGRRVVQYATGLFASQAYLDRNWAARGPQGEGLTWIGWGEREKVPQWVKDSPFPKARLRHVVREGVMVGRLVAQGMGMSFLPVYAAAYVPDLVRVPGTEIRPDRSIWLLLHSDMQRTTRVRLLVDHLAQEIKALRPVFLGSQT